MISVPAALHAATTEQEAYRQIADGLREEVQLLSGISDAATAQAAVEPLRQVIRKLAALNDEVDEREFWRYIDNTPDLKQPLIEEMERFFVQLRRMEEAKCFGCTPLRKLLEPMFRPAA